MRISKNFYQTLFCVTIAIVPGVAFAALDLKSLINKFVDVIVIMIPVASGIALLVFFYGLTKYIFNQSNANEKENGKYIIVWGLVGLFVLFSIYGIVFLFQETIFGGLPAGYQSSYQFPETSLDSLNDSAPGGNAYDTPGYTVGSWANSPPSPTNNTNSVNISGYTSGGAAGPFVTPEP